MGLKEKNAGVIVLGGHIQGYGIVRIFGENGIPCVVIDNTNKNIARHSKFCVAFYKSSYQNLNELLCQFGKNSKYEKWLLFPTDDYYVRFLSKNRTKLSSYYNVTIDEWKVIELFFNKNYSYPLAQKVNVPIPRTFYPKSLEDVRTIFNDIPFPCILKPAIMLNFYRHFKKKVFVCNNYQELELNYIRAIEKVQPDEILIQEIIPGNSENQYSVGIFFDRDKSYNYLVGRRKRQHPIDFGNATTFAETVDVQILVEYAHRILSAANFWGICEVEFKYDNNDKKYKFLEVNPRTWKWHLISKAAGIPFLMSMYKYMIEGVPIRNAVYQNCGWCDLVTDFPVILKMMICGIYKRSKTKNIIHAVINKKDIKPFLYELIYFPYLLLKR